MSDEEVKALAEKMGEAKLGPPRGTKILASALMYQGDLEALARVALEWVEGRNNPWKPVAQFLKRAGAPVIKKEEPK